MGVSGHSNPRQSKKNVNTYWPHGNVLGDINIDDAIAFAHKPFNVFLLDISLKLS